MARKLSTQLSELSIRALNLEDAIAAAQKEARDKIADRQDDARAKAIAAVQKVERELNAIANNSTTSWAAARAKIDADMNTLQAKNVRSTHERNVKQATSHAELLEQTASFAIDYAIASIEQANLAVLDAIEARFEAEATTTS